MTRRFRTADFEFAYDPDAVAQRPLPDRSGGRLLVLDRRSGALAHHRFGDFPALVHPGDLLVLNESRVLPARLLGRRAGGGAAEVFLVHEDPDGTWLAMVRPGSRLRPGRTIRFGEDGAAEIVAYAPGGMRRVRFLGSGGAHAIMERHGTVPLPPYIDRPPEPGDRERYQTVYAAVDGSVAAPTAGLHFTSELLARLARRGVGVAKVVLHVGPGTFKPVEADDPAQHLMHAEWYDVPADTAAAINRAKGEGGRVWAVGTTVARTLETVATAPAGPPGPAREMRGWTSLFIYPPYTFRIVDALLTNFHRPRSTLLMLVAAFAGYDLTMNAYREATAAGYRLFSYGDAMAIT